MAAGCVILSMMPATLGIPGYIAPIVVITVGYALFQTANNTAVMTDIRPDQRGVISGLLNLSRNLGLITGASVMGAVFALASATTDITTAHPEAVATGMRITFAVAAMLIVVALAIAVGAYRRASRNRAKVAAREKQTAQRRSDALGCGVDAAELSALRWTTTLSHDATRPPLSSEANLRLAVEAAGVALWSWNVDSDTLTMDENGYRLWGVPISEFVSFEDLSGHIHPADRDRVRAAFAATRADCPARTRSTSVSWWEMRCTGCPRVVRATMSAWSAASCSGSSSTSPDASRPRKATNCSPAR